MPLLVTANAIILCAHGGKVTPIPSQRSVLAGGAPVLCMTDLMGAPIVGCPIPPTPATKPCTTVISVLPGSWSLKVLAAGKPALLATASGLTDGIPPGTVSVVSPGQTSVQG
ncbi:MAG: hypothetical protein JWN65_1202 [Solirubrobacterales bacterium]|nr:hypothetical protein [Solirubrobacterales bacterium]